MSSPISERRGAVMRLVPAVEAYSPQGQVCMQCGVRQFALFGALDEAQLARLHLRIHDIHLEAGQSLYMAQQAGQMVYTIREGVLRLERTSAAGDRRILRLAGRTDLIGLETLLGQTYSADAVACTDLAVCGIPRELVDELSAREPGLARDLMKRWQRALDDADEWLTELAQGPARQRMLRLLLKLSEHGESNGRIWMPTRQDMGAMLAMTLETASRLVSALRREGVIVSLEGRYATVAMPALLAQLKQAAP